MSAPLSSFKKKENKMYRSNGAYANKLERFLKYKEYDKDVCLLLGAIASKSIRKHTALIDEIKAAIADLRMNNTDAMYLVMYIRAQL